MSSHFASSHYGASHYLSSHYGRDLAIVLPDILPGGGSSKKRHGPSARQFQIQQQIEEENAVMLSVIKAFLKVVD